MDARLDVRFKKYDETQMDGTAAQVQNEFRINMNPNQDLFVREPSATVAPRDL